MHMHTETDPATRLTRIAGTSLVRTLASWVLLGLFTSPVLFVALERGSTAASVGVLAIFGWGIWFGQRIPAADGVPDHDAGRTELGEFGPRLAPLVAVGTLVYYNLVLAVTLSAALAISTAGFPALAAIVAVLYPAYDMAIVRRGYPLSIAGVLAVVIASSLVIADRGDVTWRDIEFGDVLYRAVGVGVVDPFPG